jgi:hypothetical protein
MSYGWGKSQLRRQGSKATDQHGRGLDNLQKQVLLGHGKLGKCVIQLSKFLNHTLATHNQVDSFFENINHNDGKGAFTLTLFEMTITDCPGFHVPHCKTKTYLSKTEDAIFLTRII